MMPSNTMYHSLIQYPNIPNLHHQSRLQAQLQALRHNQSIAQQLDRRKLFHNFVTQKMQETKLINSLDQQMNHHQYLDRIDRLRRQRQQLGRDKLLIRLAGTYNDRKQVQYESDHVVKPNLLNTPQPIHNSLQKSLVQPSHFKIENEKTFTPSYKYKDKLAHNIASRWVPPHLQGEDQQRNKKDKEIRENQRWFSEIEKQMDQIRNKINNRKGRENDQQIRNLEQGIRNRAKPMPNVDNRERKHVSFIDQVPKDVPQKNNNKKRNYESLHQSYVEFKKKNPILEQTFNESKEQSNNNGSIRSEKNSPKKRKTKKNKEKCNELGQKGQQRLSEAIRKIKNRLDYSMIVYQDSEHRTINHEKMHLANKYDNECKMRKDLVGKICGAKCVAQRYNLILT